MAAAGGRTAAAGLLSLLCASAVEEGSRPPCRKSPELHSIVPESSSPDGSHFEDIIAFGGKGFAWAEKGREEELAGREDSQTLLDEEDAEEDDDLDGEDAEEDDDDAVEEEGPAAEPRGGGEPTGLISIARRRRTLKKQVDFFGDTWKFSLESDAWLRVAVGSESPAKRWKPSSTEFEDGRAVALFGGCKSTHMEGVMNDLWVFRLRESTPARGTWTRVDTANPPMARRGHIAVANRSHLVVYGGKGLTLQRTGKGRLKMKSTVLVDLWSLPLTALAAGAEQGSASWVPGAPFPGSPRWGASGTLLAGGGREVLAVFGGRNKNPGFVTHEQSEEAYTYFNELWLYDFATDSWEKAPAVTTGDGLPHARDHHGACSVDGRLYVFGGRTSEVAVASSVLNDVWSYSLSEGRWTRHPDGAKPAPMPLYMPGVTGVQPGNKMYPHGAVVVFGGEHLPGSTKRTTLNGVWAYDLAYGQWDEIGRAHV